MAATPIPLLAGKQSFMNFAIKFVNMEVFMFWILKLK
jgi:hypothetical protein